MKKITRKQFLQASAGALAAGALAACGASSSGSGSTSGSASAASSAAGAASGGMLFDQPVTISTLIRQHPSWPYQEDWYVQKLIKEVTNVDLDVTVVPSDGYAEKLNLVMSSGNLPDIIWSTGNTIVRQYGSQGAFINILEHMDDMPNFKKW